jgi:hypothetical protein
MTESRSIIVDPVVRYGMISILLGILLLIFLQVPLLFIQIVVVVLPIVFSFLAFFEMYKRNNRKFGEAFMYGGGALVLFTSFELVLVYFLLKYTSNMSIYSSLASNFDGLEFIIAIFALGLSVISNIETSVGIQNDLEKIKKHLGIQENT